MQCPLAQCPIDQGLDDIQQGINSLNEWTGKKTVSVLFDSCVDDGCSNEEFVKRIMNKSHLYFISYDTKDNVFGGYVDTVISKTDEFLTDPNSFVFSLKRNGVITNKKYPITKGNENRTFFVDSNKGYDILYQFGGFDICVCKIDVCNCCCNPSVYDYGDDDKPLSEDFSEEFAIKRVVVVQMD
ncbi:TLDc domain-containing protein [Entamoeba marina]